MEWGEGRVIWLKNAEIEPVRPLGRGCGLRKQSFDPGRRLRSSWRAPNGIEKADFEPESEAGAGAIGLGGEFYEYLHCLIPGHAELAEFAGSAGSAVSRPDFSLHLPEEVKGLERGHIVEVCLFQLGFKRRQGRIVELEYRQLHTSVLGNLRIAAALLPEF